MAQTHAFLHVSSQYVYTVEQLWSQGGLVLPQSTTYLAVSLTVTASKQPSVNYYTVRRCIIHYSVATLLASLPLR